MSLLGDSRAGATSTPARERLRKKGEKEHIRRYGPNVIPCAIEIDGRLGVAAQNFIKMAQGEARLWKKSQNEVGAVGNPKSLIAEINVALTVGVTD